MISFLEERQPQTPIIFNSFSHSATLSHCRALTARRGIDALQRCHALIAPRSPPSIASIPPSALPAELQLQRVPPSHHRSSKPACDTSTYSHPKLLSPAAADHIDHGGVCEGPDFRNNF